MVQCGGAWWREGERLMPFTPAFAFGAADAFAITLFSALRYQIRRAACCRCCCYDSCHMLITLHAAMLLMPCRRDISPRYAMPR